MATKFDNVAGSAIGPARWFGAITAQVGPQPRPLKAIRAGAAGTITLRMQDMTAAEPHPVMAGEIISGIITHVTAIDPAQTVIGYD